MRRTARKKAPPRLQADRRGEFPGRGLGLAVSGVGSLHFRPPRRPGRAASDSPRFTIRVHPELSRSAAESVGFRARPPFSGLLHYERNSPRNRTVETDFDTQAANPYLFRTISPAPPVPPTSSSGYREPTSPRTAFNESLPSPNVPDREAATTGGPVHFSCSPPDRRDTSTATIWAGRRRVRSAISRLPSATSTSNSWTSDCAKPFPPDGE